MIVVLSTSSPQASVALLTSQGEALWSGSVIAPMAASGACLSLMEEGLRATGVDLGSAELFVADIGPGSFTGVRVGVTLAKAFAYVLGVRVAGINAFDLISADETVALPNKRGEWFIRIPREAPILTTALPVSDCIGFGAGFDNQTYPQAVNASTIVDRLVPESPESMIPKYLVDPSISKPRKPFGASYAP